MISFLPETGLVQSLSLHIVRSHIASATKSKHNIETLRKKSFKEKARKLLLSKIGSETTGFKARVNFPGTVPSKNTWKHNRTAFRSIFCGSLR
jgi:hypothetical protein